MELRLARVDVRPSRTLGDLYLDGQFLCHTLEGDNPIPPGTYGLVWHDSPHLHARVPMLVDVPGRSYILIHVGNTARDTQGCILVGLTREPDAVGLSYVAFQRLLNRLQLPATITVDAAPLKTA